MEENLFLQAIELYADITGVKVPESEKDRYGSFSMRSYDVMRSYDHLKEAIDLDPSEVTANLMLSYYVRNLLGDQKLSMLDLLKDPDGYLKKLEKPRELLDLVNREDVTRAREQFIDRLTQALKRYGADEREDVQKTLTHHDQIAFLRRDALRGVERLQVNQFLSGAPEADGVKPVFHAKVYQWWNINSLLQAATQMPSGVSLNLIRDKDAYQSYFVFCIRNGANLFVLHDAPEYSHPLQGMMTRRPDRAIAERSCRAWFPYDLLGLKWDEEYERYYIENSDEKAVAIYQQEWKPLSPISAFENPSETIWCTMMLDLIVRKFWGQGYQAPALSYTGEMLKIEDRLIEKAQSANLPVAAYHPLSLAPLTIEQMLTDRVREDQVGKKGTDRNRWMEERYKDQIDPAILNLTEQSGTQVLLPGFKTKYDHRNKGVGGTEIGGGLRKLTPSEVSKLGHFEREDVKNASLVVMDSTRFGTREQIEADRVFIARSNMARQITNLARAEYEQRKDEVLKWYEKACRKNLPAILSWAANKDIWLDMGLKPGFSSNEAGGRQRHEEVDPNAIGSKQRIFRSWIKRVDLAEEKRTKDYDYSAMGAINVGGYDRVAGWRCAVTDARASYYVAFFPSNALELATLAGCKVEELPDVLQHWQVGRDYVGNHILSRIDPMEWQAHDPWRKLNLRLRVPLSIRGLAKIEKAPALPPLPWLASAEDVERFRKMDEQNARMRAAEALPGQDGYRRPKA